MTNNMKDSHDRIETLIITMLAVLLGLLIVFGLGMAGIQFLLDGDWFLGLFASVTAFLFANLIFIGLRKVLYNVFTE